MTKKASVFKQTELFRDLDAAVCEKLAARSVEKRLERDEILFVAGEDAVGMFVIASGSVRAFRTGHDGREQIIHVERAVTTIAEVPVFDGGKYPSTVAAEETSILHFLDREEILRLSIEHPQISLAAARLLAKRLRKCAELVETLSLREVGQRLAALLVTEARRNAPETRTDIRIAQKLTHVQLAARIGTVREVVSRAISRLQDQRLIEVKGKEIWIRDVDRLAAYAEIE